jgi:hypothetical protein
MWSQPGLSAGMYGMANTKFSQQFFGFKEDMALVAGGLWCKAT